MTQKHSKKDYDQIKKMTVAEIFEAASVAPKQVKFEDSARSKFEDIIKIEQKKKKMAKGDRKKKQLELQEKLSVPGAIGSADEALELADQQRLTVKDLSRKEIRRLEKLKKRAESPIESTEQPTNITKAPKEEAPATSVKLQFTPSESDVSLIEAEFNAMDEKNVFDAKPSDQEVR